MNDHGRFIQMKLIGVLLLSLVPVFAAAGQGAGYHAREDRVDVALEGGTLSIRPLTENAVRIKYFVGSEAPQPELILTQHTAVPKFRVTERDAELHVDVKHIQVVLDEKTGAVSFADRSGKIFLREQAGGRKLVPDSVMGEPCFMAEQAFDSPKDELLLGLGQFQDGHFNLRSVSRKLIQTNLQISIPFLYSSRGYGILWHQYGLTWFNPADHAVKLTQRVDASGKAQDAEVTTTSGTQRVSRQQSVYTGSFNVPRDGDYSLMLDLGDMENRHLLVVDDSACIDQSNLWLPPAASTVVKLSAGSHSVKIVCKSSNHPALTWKETEDATVFRSPHAHALDYVVFHDTSADGVIAAYRKLSGEVPMLPRWAYGFWQCRERYTSGTHLVETVEEFRKRNLPMDVIVQDWQYWGKYGWGVPKFDETHYPDPERFIKQLHDLHAHFNISVWENLDRKSDVAKAYVGKDLFIHDSPWIDMFNPEAQKTHWHVLDTNLFRLGVDSWWMDATEPENDALTGKRTHLGPGEFYRLTYPLFVSKAVYEGQRTTDPGKRVCILTRSAFAGQQRYGTINWSGDIGGTWDSFKRQLTAGLNYSVTGMPYWTTDIGGFFRPGPSQYTDSNYHELLTRWFQWGVFTPIFRVHGYQSETEPWKYGPQVESNMRAMLTLRYRLMPYIYSEAWQVTHAGSTMMRPLIMDFAKDHSASGQSSEYMFGRALLVAPVTAPHVTQWSVYLPHGTVWYDFWSGARSSGMQTLSAEAPIEKIPLYVKAGSIIPMGPAIQYAAESNDPIELRIYPGADGSFIFYEDENDGYNYERGMRASIAFTWNDAAQTLSIGKRQGRFPGMRTTRTFKLVVVSPNHGAGSSVTEAVDKRVAYSGTPLTIVMTRKQSQ